MTELVTPLLDSIRVRVTRVLPAQVRTAVEKLGEEQIWWRPNEKSNSVGNLVLHLAGSLNLYLNNYIGGIEYHRDRDAECAAREPRPNTEWPPLFNVKVTKADELFAQ